VKTTGFQILVTLIKIGVQINKTNKQITIFSILWGIWALWKKEIRTKKFKIEIPTTVNLK